MNNEFAKIIKTDELRFKYAKGMRDIVGKEIHKYHEIFFFLGGDAVFISENGKTPLSPDTAVIIPKDTFHCFTVIGNDCDYIRCVYNFTEVRELDEIINKVCGRVRLIRSEKITAEFSELCGLAEADIPHLERDILLKALFARLLTTLSLTDGDETSYTAFTPLTTNVLKLIAKNRGSSLSAAEIAAELCVSVSHLEHVFKRDMNIPLHKYVLEKRLVRAKRMIFEGVSTAEAAAVCGFGDYSGFYKQYKKYFGAAPSSSKTG
ncbi:MAG: AraC family transcriptional regulator [Ruminococcaceae bacterium]|nr:AraC family transcriptional regulator [Oscillospiraceae bacterium]